MKYPTLAELNTSREMIDVFGGYNHNLRIGGGEFYDMKNLTSTHYPVLSPRPQRGVYVPPGEDAETPRKVLGMITKDALCYVMENADGNTSTFYINGHPIEFDGNDTLNAEPKTLVSMGSYVIIMPDKNYINTKDYSDKGKIEKSIEYYSTFEEESPPHVTFSLCKLDGSGYAEGEIKTSTTAPDDPTDLMLWLDTSSDPNVLKQYSKTNSQWVSIATTYIRISFPSGAGVLTDCFADGDFITISGIEKAAKWNVEINSLGGIITDISHYEQAIELDNKAMEAVEVGHNYIIVKGILNKPVSVRLGTKEKASITIKRQMPIMDTRFIIESGNRLWGCNYGIAHNGEVVNEIYASKLGDFKNWYAFSGISTDSYVAGVGTDGEFTGAIAHRGFPLFFKENCMHKVYGNYPANFQIQTTDCRGVQKGCHKSLAIVNETLFYKSRSAICAYDGSLPVEVSSALGEVVYSDAVAGVLGNKYYISMRDSEDYHLFVFDTQKGMWHREDKTQASDFCNCDGELYYVDTTDPGDRVIKTVNGTGLRDTAPIKWVAETGIIGTDSPDKKYISRLVLRLSLEVGTRVFFYIEYDSSGSWEHQFTISGTSLRSFSIPIRPKRCDHLRLRIEGEGDAKIFSITKTIEIGSDV